jgi:hypothetical protein
MALHQRWVRLQSSSKLVTELEAAKKKTTKQAITTQRPRLTTRCHRPASGVARFGELNIYNRTSGPAAAFDKSSLLTL